ncbi:DNA integrity scanning diadenylate cyclase DisA [Dietzia sp. B32]|uniref:DNA integrity scanning diadenylate cyclase DisA n=1 Tax=Dietzia sp. B32 TaxID=2915130 RepID=UPI0021AE2B3E|nr:DNA integrity scanning diadenylate cyclase DisA [Dietzia sp. B32]UVE94540.1 DNA integrity scanning diadenylate cyclase DisA [Dietzia sp. B32]
MRAVLRRLAPGTPLRDALDRIRRSGTGGLVVLGDDPAVQAICDGGVDLDVEFAPARLRELSKMDGAVVLSTDGSRITRANVHLVPDPSIPAVETGTRHRAAERTAMHTGVPTVAVSASMTTVTVYAGGLARVLADPVVLLARADQTVATMERHGARTARARARLDRAEMGGYASVRDVVTMAQRLLRLERLGAELAELTVEMGEYGRQTTLQLEELLSDTPDELWGLVADHLQVGPVDGDARSIPTPEQITSGLERLAALSDADLLLPAPVARCLGLPAEPEDLDEHITARGHRMLAHIPRLRPVQITALVERFGSVPALLAAEQSDFADVEGVGALWARHVRQRLTGLGTG